MSVRSIDLDVDGQPRAADPDAVRGLADARERPVLFLSASVPDRRSAEAARANLPAAVRNAFAGTWDVFVPRLQDVRARRVESAVAWVAREALSRGYTLVFGGHPAISPMVLEVARQQAPRDTRVRVVVFQAELYRAQAGPSVARLGEWPHGCVVWTATPPGLEPERQRALTEMRERMMGLRPRLSVFIGGMEGLLEEWTLAAGSPRYPIASTGGAAAFLADHRAHERAGDATLHHLLANGPSYAEVAARILADAKQP